MLNTYIHWRLRQFAPGNGQILHSARGEKLQNDPLLEVIDLQQQNLYNNSNQILCVQTAVLKELRPIMLRVLVDCSTHSWNVLSRAV